MENRLIQGDCLAVMPTLAAASVDLVLCDLPYGTTACKWDTCIDLPSLWKQYKRICKGAVVLTAAQPFTSLLVCSNLEQFKYQLVWQKSRVGGFLDAKFRPLRAHEDVCVFSSAGCSNGSKFAMLYNPQGILSTNKKWTNKTESSNTRCAPRKEGRRTESNYPRSVLAFDSEAKPVHPTQKPVALMEYLIRTYTHEGMTVLDNCMGSGTTGIACVNTGRNFVGIEQDANYFETARKRIEDAKQRREADKSRDMLPQGFLFA